MSGKLFGKGTHVAAATSLAMIAQQVAGKAARDALYLSSFDADSLPYMMATSALLSLPVIVWLSRVLVRHSPAKVLPILLASSAAVLAAAWAVAQVSPAIAAIAVYFHSTLFGPAVLTSFWSLINEHFDPHAAKGAVSRIAAGGTLGGVFGALAAWGMSTVVEPRAVLLLLAGLHAVCVVGAFSIRLQSPLVASTAETEAAELPVPPTRTTPWVVLREAPFLRNLALLVGWGAAISALLDYVFGAQAAETIGKGPALLSYFALFGLAVSVVSFVVQVSMGSKVIEKLGLAWNIALLPILLAGGGVVAFVVPGLVSAAVLRGVEMVERNTLFRSAYELLYTPIPEDRKRAAKALIDIGCDRVGTILGSALVFIALRVFTEASPVLIGAIVALALLGLPLARELHRGYVTSLEEGMRDRAKALDLPDVVSPHEVVADQTHTERPEDRRLRARPSHPEVQALLRSAGTLLSSDVAAMRRVLAQWSLNDRPLTALVIPLLAHPELNRDALHALRVCAPHTIGQLIDVLLDPEVEFVVRRRLPRALSVCDSERTIQGLLAGIADPRFEVRYECGLALMRIAARNPERAIAREEVIEAIHREVAAQNRADGAASELDEDEEPNVLTETLERGRCDRSLEHVFTLLTLILEREPLCAAFQALHHDDVKHRGTALEYLATVLPIEVRDEIWPLLGDTSALPAAPPPTDALSVP